MTAQIGDKFGRLTILGFDNEAPKSRLRAHVLCECGNKKHVLMSNVAYGKTTSCGCGARKHFVKLGQNFGRLLVISDELHHTDRGVKVLCKCACGTEKLINILSLCNGDSNSCGCIRSEVSSKKARRHGCVGRSGYNLWHAMKSRCYNESNAGYENYGGRGIRICEEWLNSCAAFCDWVDENGYQPGLEIDREDNDGDYSPENCHFVTKIVNARNRRGNTSITAFGETKTVSEWAEDDRCIVSYESLRERVKNGIDPVLSMTAPHQPGKPLR
jgi:hypothetical protein